MNHDFYLRRSTVPHTSLRDLANELPHGERISALVAVASDGTILTWAHTDLDHPLHFDWAAKALNCGAARLGVPESHAGMLRSHKPVRRVAGGLKVEAAE